MKLPLILLFFLTTNVYASIEKQVSDISDELMCPVCRGQTVGESNSALAKDFREIIEKKLKAGESKQEIVDYFIERYGESVLASPPAKGIRLVVWVFPLLVIILGFIFMSKFIYSRRATGSKNNRAVDENKNNYMKEIEKELNDPSKL